MKKRTLRKNQPKRSQSRIKANEGKFRELILYIARQSEGDPRFGSLKLNKLLFYSDFMAYLKLGYPITGQEYFALANGPAPRYMMRVREQMTDSKEIAVRKRDTLSGTQDRILALRQEDLRQFTAQEVALVNDVIGLCATSTGTDLSELSHYFPGWRLAADKETIPYTAALVGDRLPTDSEKAFGTTLDTLAESCVAEGAASLG